MSIHTATRITKSHFISLWRGRKVAFAAAVLAFVGGCSALELGYNNGPALVHTWVTNQIDLYPDQSDLLAEQFDSLFDWHRRHELPILLVELKQVRDQAETLNTASVEEVRHFSDSIKESFYRTGQAAAPLMANALLGLWPNQIEPIQAALNESNQNYRDDHLDLSEQARRSEALDQMSNRFETWLGDLSVEQLELIQTWAAGQGFPYEDRYQRRLQSQARFMGWVEQAANRSISHADLSDSLVQWVNGWRGSDVKAVDQNLEQHRWQTAQLVVDVLQLSTLDQRLHLKEEMSDWIEALEGLIATAD